MSESNLDWQHVPRARAQCSCDLTTLARMSSGHETRLMAPTPRRPGSPARIPTVIPGAKRFPGRDRLGGRRETAVRIYVSRSRQLHRVRRQGAEPNAALRVMVGDELPSVLSGGHLSQCFQSPICLHSARAAQSRLPYWPRNVRFGRMGQPGPAGESFTRPGRKLKSSPKSMRATEPTPPEVNGERGNDV